MPGIDEVSVRELKVEDSLGCVDRTDVNGSTKDKFLFHLIKSVTEISHFNLKPKLFIVPIKKGRN